MKPTYDDSLYDRRLLDCWRRQAVVFLKINGAPVELLFRDVLASTDQIFNESILEQNPKYKFMTPALNDDGLSTIGWSQSTHTLETFDQAIAIVREHLKRTPFAIILGSVFYFPHCVEYRKVHLNHSIVLLGEKTEGEWNIVDDDQASNLDHYLYDESFIRAFYENNHDRRVRTFSKDKDVALAVAICNSLERTRNHIKSHEDSYQLFDDFKKIATNPYESLEVRTQTLHEAFSLYSGTRRLFSEFLGFATDEWALADRFRDISCSADMIRKSMIKARFSGHINVDKLQERCMDLKRKEIECLNVTKSVLGIIK